MQSVISAASLYLNYVPNCINRSSRVELHCGTISGLRSVYAVKLHPELRFMQDDRSLTVFCTVSHAEQTQRNYKYTASCEARAQIDYTCSTKVAVNVPAAFGSSYMFLYLFKHLYVTVLILQKLVLNNLTMTIVTRLAIHITTNPVNNQYISCHYVPSSDDAQSESGITLTIAINLEINKIR